LQGLSTASKVHCVHLTVLDLGSNSFQLIQARRTDAGRSETLFSAIEYVQLARHVTPQGVLTEHGIELGVAAVERLLLAAPQSAHGAPVVAIATCAIRDANNGAQFLERVRARTGLLARILSGEEEASLAYLGAASELKGPPQQLAVVDLGGGSTEIAWGKGPNVLHAVSLRLGVLALAERLAALPNRNQMAIEQFATYVRRTIEPVLVTNPELLPQSLVFASGVAKVLLALIYSFGLIAKGNVVPSVLLHGLIPRLLDAKPEDLIHRGVPAPRVTSVGPSAVVISVIADLFELDKFVVASAGLREGVVLHAENIGLQPWPTAHP
jgi:exopolyphosphatase/guanosine-5'-triphosphate,3'-diphosphate pyrophosphatase